MARQSRPARVYFSDIAARGCLIVREDEAQMPADLGGAIYVHLNKGAAIDSIEGCLKRFLEDSL